MTRTVRDTAIMLEAMAGFDPKDSTCANVPVPCYEKALTHSIGQGSSALVLIDGVEGDLTTVNPEDIETVAVLKDAASAGA